MTQTDITLNPLVDANSWRDAVCIVVDQKTTKNGCFSSGEITKELRTHRPDLHFSHWDVGEYVRDLFYSGAMRTDVLSENYVQVSRFTSGKTRSPSGSKVFVYAPDHLSAEEHEFEVEIPRASISSNSSEYSEYGSEADEGFLRSENQFQAKVHKDKRLCIPRAPFEEFVHKTGQKLGFGDKVHISLDEAVNKIKVRLQSSPNSKAYDLTKDRGRVKFMPDVSDDFCQWVSGDAFDVQVTNDGLEIDLNEPVKA